MAQKRTGNRRLQSDRKTNTTLIKDQKLTDLLLVEASHQSFIITHDYMRSPV